MTWLVLLCASRFGTSLVFMTYAATLPALIGAWGMSGVEAGSVAGALGVSFGASVAASTWIADRVGARAVFGVSAWLAAIASLVFAVFATSFQTGLVLITLIGLTQGGTYGPAMILVAEYAAPGRRGSAMGWLLAAASLGYAGSLGIAALALEMADYRVAFLASAAGPVLGVVAAGLGLRAMRSAPRQEPAAPSPIPLRSPPRRAAALLTLGYVGHGWELLGMWAWMPAFLVFATATPGEVGVGQGLAVAIGLHLSGFVASVTMGAVSDRVGRRRVLIGLAAAGAVCSFAAGWTVGAPLGVLAAFALVYGFAALGDSSVLSTAMTEAVPQPRLGSALALRSVLGFGAGALAPVVFGAVLGDPGPGGAGRWGWAFAMLGVGGLVATLSAVGLPSGSSPAALSAD